MANLREARGLVQKWRRVLSIDPRWRITVRLDSDEVADGSMAFDGDCWRADLALHENLDGSRLEEVVLHELIELASHEEYELWWATVTRVDPGSTLAGAIDEQFRRAKNRFIEKIVPALISSPGLTKRPR